MKTILILITLTLSFSVNAADIKLLAKCGFSANQEPEIINPGSSFFYVVEKNNKLYVINGIAHEEDNITIKDLTLKASLPLIPLQKDKNKRMYWVPSSFLSGGEKNRNFLPVLLNREGFQTPSGVTSYTDSVYPACFVWK